MSYYFPVSIGDRCGGGGHLSVPVSLTYADIILQLYSPGGVEVDLLECLSHDIVGLSLAGLGCLDGSGLVYVTLVVDIELAKGVCQAEYVILLELGELPVLGGEMVSPLVSRCLSSARRSSIVGCARRRGRGLPGMVGLVPLQFEDVHDCVCMHSMLLLVGDAGCDVVLEKEGQ